MSDENDFISKMNVKSDLAESSLDNSLEIYKVTSGTASIQIRGKNDSGYSSFISQKNVFIRTSSPIVTQQNNNKTESPGTSYSSRNSALIDEEMENMFTNSGQFLPIERSTEKIKESPFYILRDLDYSPEIMNFRHSVRNSPWTVRPDSAPLQEEDEDSDKEAQYSCSLPQEPLLMTSMPVAGRCTHPARRRRYSLDVESELRKDLIACKLREIADKMHSSRKTRPRLGSLSFDNLKPAVSRRHSYSSFADIVPCGCGSAVDLIWSLYNVYKSHSRATLQSTTVASSQSMANMAPRPHRTNNRNRSYTE